MPALFQESIERRPALARILPFVLLLVGIAFDGLLKDHAATLPWDLRWDYAVRNICALLALLWLWPQLPELRVCLPESQPRTPGAQRGTPGEDAGALGAAGSAAPLMALTGFPRNSQWLLAGALGLAVFALWIAPPLRAFAQSAGGFDARWLSAIAPAGSGSGFTPLDAAGAIDWPLALTRLAGSALVVPVAEELFWRSFVMRWIDLPDFLRRDPRELGLRAWALQALLFGAEHELWLAGILAGLAYGWLYRQSGRLWLPIAAHALTNALLGVWVLRGAHWAYW